MNRENLISAFVGKGYKPVADCPHCTIMKKSIKDLTKCLIIYPERVVVQEMIDLEPPKKVAELSMEQVEKMLQGGQND